MMAAVVVPTVIAVRILCWQGRVDETFNFPNGVQVVCIGNSHTGCTWFESEEFHNKVLWTSSTGFTFHYLRFLELERRGALNKGIKVCIVDCDGPATRGFKKESLRARFLDCLPFAWRYIDQMPESVLTLAYEVLTNTGHDFHILEKPPEEVPNWTTRTKEEQKSNILHQYGVNPEVWDPALYPEEWEASLLKMVSYMKNRCERYGIRFICFAAPLTSQSPARANKVVWDRETAIIEKVRDLGCEYYDFRLSVPDNKFRDSHHLLKSTSYDFTKKFYRDVLGIIK